MNHKMDQLFKQFDGDLTALALYSYLSTVHGGNESPLISKAELSKRTGLGRRKIDDYLSRFKEMELLESFLVPGRGLFLRFLTDSVPKFALYPMQNVQGSVREVQGYTQNVQGSVHQVQGVCTSGTGLTRTSAAVRSEGVLSRGSELKLKPSNKSALKSSVTTQLTRTPSTTAKVKSKLKPRATVEGSLTKKSRPKPSKPAKTKEPTLGSQIWNAYEEEYRRRYNIAPVRNAMTNKQAQQIGLRLGVEGVEVVRFYVRHSDKFFVIKRHPIGLCLSDAERLYSDWKLGQGITSFDSELVERKQRNKTVFDEIKSKYDAKYSQQPERNIFDELKDKYATKPPEE